jgi:hypothetical protein
MESIRRTATRKCANIFRRPREGGDPFTLTQPAYIAAKFELDNFAPAEPEFYEPRFNVAPTQRIVVIPTRRITTPG